MSRTACDRASQLTSETKTTSPRVRALLVVLLVLSAAFPIAGIAENQFGSTPQFYQTLIYLIIVPSAVFIPVVLVKKGPSVALAAGVVTGAIHLVPPAIALPLAYLPVSVPAVLHILVSIVLIGAGLGQAARASQRQVPLSISDRSLVLSFHSRGRLPPSRQLG